MKGHLYYFPPKYSISAQVNFYKLPTQLLHLKFKIKMKQTTILQNLLGGRSSKSSFRVINSKNLNRNKYQLFRKN